MGTYDYIIHERQKAELKARETNVAGLDDGNYLDTVSTTSRAFTCTSSQAASYGPVQVTM